MTINTGEIPAIYLEDPAQEPQWERVHIRGVDDLSTDDIRRFAMDYFPDAEPHVQWIDDTSANVVYKDRQSARQALLALVTEPTTSEDIQNEPQRLRQAKALTTHPGSILTVRVAVLGDRKKKGARDASRYYLMHPEADPTERMRREFAADRPSRSENGDYRRRRFDEREHRRRRDQDRTENDQTADFDASMYDDQPSDTTKQQGGRGRELFPKSRGRRRSASPTANPDSIAISDSDDDGRNRRRRNGYRNRESPPPYSRRDPHPHPRDNTGKELFGGAGETRKGGGMRSDNVELFPKSRDTSSVFRSESADTERKNNAAAARRLKADLLATTSQNSPRSHRRSRAIDTRVEEDLSERFGRKSISMDSTKSVTQHTANAGKELFGDNGGFSIKGTASQGFSIKGRADAQAVKELFPEQYSQSSRGMNAGKELFDQPVRNRGPRQRAGDLFD